MAQQNRVKRIFIRKSVTIARRHAQIVATAAEQRGVGFSEMLRTIIHEWERAQPLSSISVVSRKQI